MWPASLLAEVPSSNHKRPDSIMCGCTNRLWLHAKSRRASPDDCTRSHTMQVSARCRGDQAGSVKGPFREDTLSCLATMAKQMSACKAASQHPRGRHDPRRLKCQPLLFLTGHASSHAHLRHALARKLVTAVGQPGTDPADRCLCFRAEEDAPVLRHEASTLGWD